MCHEWKHRHHGGKKVVFRREYLMQYVLKWNFASYRVLKYPHCLQRNTHLHPLALRGPFTSFVIYKYL